MSRIDINMNTANVFIDSPFRNTSLIYKTGYYCIDPIIMVEFNRQIYCWVPSTEYEKAKKQKQINHVFNLNQELEAVRDNHKLAPLKSSVLISFFHSHNINKILVQENFPLMEADNLRKHDIIVTPVKSPFYQARVSKTRREIEIVREISNKIQTVMQEVHDVLAASSITNKNELKYDNVILTSQWMQDFIIKSFIDKNLITDVVIAAAGDQGCDPHEFGYGKIPAHTSIIVDIFPRDRSNLYYSDMTRTFCKGKAGDELKKMYQTVKDGQQIGLDNIRAGIDGKVIHKKIQDYFESQGFKTGTIDGVLQGFFHGTGHGVGLECHEAPYISSNGTDLPENSIVTVEPGLYYLGTGGVRIEDIVVVRKDGVENLITIEKKLEIE